MARFNSTSNRVCARHRLKSAKVEFEGCGISPVSDSSQANNRLASGVGWRLETGGQRSVLCFQSDLIHADSVHFRYTQFPTEKAKAESCHVSG